MPYSKKAKYYHIRQKNPKLFEKDSFRVVPLSHTNYRGTKFKKDKNTKAIVGKLKKSGKWSIQSILVKK